MESPAKRRKKNDTKASPLPNRGLEFFFGKQARKNEKSQVPALKDGAEANGEGSIDTDEAAEERRAGLTDEELARKLQEEWAREDGQVLPNAQNGTTDQPNHLSPTEHGFKEDAE